MQSKELEYREDKLYVLYGGFGSKCWQVFIGDTSNTKFIFNLIEQEQEPTEKDFYTLIDTIGFSKIKTELWQKKSVF